MTNWQSMETVPLDGRDLLLFCPDFKEIMIAFYRDSGTEGTRGKFIWQMHGDGGCIAESVSSHWMPLPEPPQ